VQPDIQPIPGVDRGDRQGQLHDLAFVELVVDLALSLRGQARIGETGERLAPAQGRSFPAGEAVCFLPYGDERGRRLRARALR
jgi:hypothetical protein